MPLIVRARGGGPANLLRLKKAGQDAARLSDLRASDGDPRHDGGRRGRESGGNVRSSPGRPLGSICILGLRQHLGLRGLRRQVLLEHI